MRIAIAGGRYAGKSTLGRYLEDNYGWTFLDYTGQLKRFLATAMTALHQDLEFEGVPGYGPNERVSVQYINECKELFRPLLQDLGTYLGYDKGFYVAQMLQQWRALGFPTPVYFDNVRFPAQFELLKAEGFVLVALQIRTDTQAKRAGKLGVDEDTLKRQGQHKAEAGVVPELLLDGDLPIATNAELLSRLAGVGQRRAAAKSRKDLARVP